MSKVVVMLVRRGKDREFGLEALFANGAWAHFLPEAASPDGPCEIVSLQWTIATRLQSSTVHTYSKTPPLQHKANTITCSENR
jgi:hypothetical protein